MKTGVLTNPPDLSDYVLEILRTWGLAGDGNLCWQIPASSAAGALAQVQVDGEAVESAAVSRYYESVALVALPRGKETCAIQAVYR